MTAIRGVHTRPLTDARLERAQLTAAHRGVEVAHAVVEPDLAMLVPRSRLPRLRREVTCVGDDRLVIGRQRAAATGGHDLVAVERQDRHPAVASGRLAVALRAQRLGGILDQWHAVPGADLGEASAVGDGAVQVDGDDRCGKPSPVGPHRQFLGEQIGVDVPGERLAVDEARVGADVRDGERAGTKREVADQHVVAGLDPDGHQCQVDRGRAARERRHRLDPGELGELVLEGGDVGTCGRHPAGIERLQEQLALGLAHLGR